MMGKKVPWGDVQESSLVPDGCYHVKCESITAKKTKEANKLMYDPVYRIIAPKGFKGLPVFDHYVIGSDEDPAAKDPDTWKGAIGARNMKRAFKKMGLDVGGTRDIDELINEAEGQELLLLVSIETQKKGQYKGRKQNRIDSYYAIGEHEVGIEEPDEDDDEGDDDEDEAPSPKKRALKKKSAPADDDDEPEDDDEEEEEEEEEPAPKKKAKAKKAPVEDDEDDEEEEEESDEDEEDEPAPKKKAKKKGPLVKCSICKKDVPKDEFPDHVEAHEAEE